VDLEYNKNIMKVSEVRFLKSVSINTKEVYFEEKPEIIFV
jgi:hypothetical protein